MLYRLQKARLFYHLDDFGAQDVLMQGCRAARQLDAGAINLNDLSFQAVFSKLEAIGAESIRQDHLRASIDIFAMNTRHDSRVSQVKFIETFIEAYPAHMQYIAHGAISKQYFS
jgi:hypothetical protein